MFTLPVNPPPNEDFTRLLGEAGRELTGMADTAALCLLCYFARLPVYNAIALLFAPMH